MGSNKTDLVDVQRRRRWVLQKRREGWCVRKIAREAEEHFGEEQLPASWDAAGRYVSKDIKRALKQSREEVEEIAKDYRELHINRLENLLSELWPYAQEHSVEKLVDEDTGETVEISKPPDPRIVDRVLSIMDRLAKFHHVEDAPDSPGDRGDTQNVFIEVNQKLKQSDKDVDELLDDPDAGDPKTNGHSE